MGENFEMSDREAADDAAFAQRIAAPLRAPERAHPSLEKRVMDRVRMEGPALYPQRGESHESWWWTKRVFEFTPLTGLAVAAGVTAIVALSGVAIGTRIGDQSKDVARVTTPLAKPDTVQLVRFVFVDSKASSVELVGDLVADHRVDLHVFPLVVGECARLEQHRVFDADLSDVVEEGAEFESLELLLA